MFRPMIKALELVSFLVDVVILLQDDILISIGYHLLADISV